MADGSVTIEVTLTKDQLEKGLKSLKSTINNALPSASKTLSTFANGFSKLGNLATSAGKSCTVVTAGITGVFTAAASKAKNFIDVYESAIAVFTKQLGSKTNAVEMYNQLLDIAKGSRYAQEYIVSAGQTLVAMGVDAKHTAKYVQVATDAMSGMGKSGSEVQAMAELFGKMSIQTTLYTEDLNQLLNSGVRVYDILAAKYKKNTSAIKEMASEGKLTSKDFEYLMDVLAGNIKEMEEFSIAGTALAGKSGTLAGTIDSLSSSFRTFSLNLLGVDARTESGEKKISKINDVLSALGTMLENVGSKFSFVGNWIESGLDKAKITLEKFNETLNKMSSEQLESIAKAVLGIATAGPALLGVGKGFSTLSGVFNGLSSGVKILEGIPSRVSGLVEIINGLNGTLGGASKVFTTFFSSINSGFSTMFDGSILNKGINSIITSFLTLGGKIGTFLSPIGNIFSTLGGKINSFISPAITGFQTLASKAVVMGRLIKFNIGETLNQAFPNLSNGLGKITNAFGGLFGKIGSSMGSFLPIFTKAFNITAIIGLVVTGLGLLQGQFGEQINSFLQMVTQKGPEIITNLVNGIVSKLPDLIAKGGELLQNLLTAIIANLPSLIQGGIQIISSLVIGIAQQLPTLIPMAIEAIITIVTSLLDNIDLLIDAAIELIIGLAEGLITAIPILIEKIPVIIEKLINAIVNNLPKLIEMGITLIIKLAEGLIKAIPTLVKAIPQIISALINGLGQLPGMVWDIGKNIVTGLWEGISNMASWLWNKITGWCSSIFDGIKNFFGIHSPSKLFENEIGKYLALGLGEGFDDNLDKVYRQMQSAVDFETQKLSTNLSTTASVNRNLNVTLNQSKSDIYLDSRKVGQIITPYISKTIRIGGI